MFLKNGQHFPLFERKKRTKHNNSEPVLEALVHGKIRKASDGPIFFEWKFQGSNGPKKCFFENGQHFPLFWGKKNKDKNRNSEPVWACPWSPCAWKDSENIGWAQFSKVKISNIKSAQKMCLKNGQHFPLFWGKNKEKKELWPCPWSPCSWRTQFSKVKISKIERAQKMFFEKRAAFPPVLKQKQRQITQILSLSLKPLFMESLGKHRMDPSVLKGKNSKIKWTPKVVFFWKTGSISPCFEV